MLKEEFLTEYRLSQNQLAKAIGISPNGIAEIVHNRRRITADTALRLSLYFGNSPVFWIDLQVHYDLKIAQQNLKPPEKTASVAHLFHGLRKDPPISRSAHVVRSSASLNLA
jgi:antitoxin HigA-1